jgi:hypothetical protein
LDLVTLGDDGTAIVLRGRSTRGFRPFQEYPSGGAGSSVALGNFNDDQALDIVGADFSGNQIEVLLGEPGGFGAPQAFPFQADVIALASAQLDGVDGDDVVTALFDVSRINVILSDFP